MRKLGQHFLKNKSALRLIAESLGATPNDTVIEIGPGHGELTEFLAATPAKKIIAIEKDETLYHILNKKFYGDSRITIIHGDALTMLPIMIQGLRTKDHSYKIAGNIPYYITGHLLRTIGELEHRPEKCSFTIQKEVAERICAMPPRMNRLAASIQFWAVAKIIKILPAGDFNPPPEVSSAIIVLDAVEPVDINTENYYTAMRALFSQPRKTIANNVASATDQKSDTVAKKLSTIGITPGDRPQNLSVDGITTIAKTFFDITD